MSWIKSVISTVINRNLSVGKSGGMKIAAQMEADKLEFMPMPIMNQEDYEFLNSELKRRLDLIKDYMLENFKTTSASKEM